jgi:hypothetical protein
MFGYSGAEIGRWAWKRIGDVETHRGRPLVYHFTTNIPPAICTECHEKPD